MALPSQPAAGYRHLVEMAIEHLEAAGTSQSAEALTGQVMGPAFARQPALVRTVEALLAADDRFTRDDAGHWRLAAWSASEGSLDDQLFAVIDVETTGGRGERHRVVEVAAVLIRGQRIAGQYESLVQPALPITRFASGLTGITPEMLDGAPPAADVLSGLRAFVGDAVVVGHNVACDLAFLNYEAIWHGLPPFGNPALDTEELAARLLPDLKRPSLARVAAAVGLAQPVRHRALADARLTAHVLLALLPRVREQGIETFEALQVWLSSRLTPRQERVRLVRSVLPAGALRDLPEAPGVYTFHDAQGSVLYVGKAASLRARVAQHFSGASLAARHHEALLDRTASVSHEIVACELDALLLESARIRALRPPYNVMERSRRGCPFLRLEAGPFPRFSAVTAIGADGHEYFGPYRTTQDVQRLMNVLRRVFQIRSCRRVLPARRQAMRLPCARLGQHLCPAPCAGLVTPEHYGLLVDLARTYIRSGSHAALEAAQAHLAGLAAGEPLRAALEEVCRRLRRVRRDIIPVEGGLAGGTALMGYPTEDGDLRLFLVRDGHLLARQTVQAATSALEAARRLTQPAARTTGETDLGQPCRGHHSGPPGSADFGLRTSDLGPGSDDTLDTDQANILLRWLHHHLGRPEVLPLAAGAGPAEVACAVEALLTRAQPFEEPDVEAEIVDAGEAFGGDVFDLEEVP